MLFVCVVLLLSQPAALSAVNPYRYFDFVQQWTPNNCYKSSHVCKQFQKEIDFWTIHGLWPSEDASHYPADCAGSTCQFNSTQISDLLDDMHWKWPTDYKGGDTKFWYHEYCKHGTCCTDVLPQEHDYFNKALQLNREVDMQHSLTEAGITPSTDETYTFSQLDTALHNSFGVTQATYWCRFVKEEGDLKRQLVFQISICIDKNPGSLKPMNCPVPAHPSCVREQPFYLLPFSVL